MPRIRHTFHGPLLLLICLPLVAFGEGRWRTKEGCRLVPNEANDGDSFHVKHKGRHYVYRLYFVDAPETDFLVPERVAEQALYWRITEADVLAIGEQARLFTAAFLAGEFTVTTKGEDARGRSSRPRVFALVSASGKDLGVALVESGLARVYGAAAAPPGGPSESIRWQRLRTAEREARKAVRGAWGRAISPSVPGGSPE